MNILHVADLHFTTSWFRWLLKDAPPHDLLVIAGDILTLNSAYPHAAQVDWLTTHWFHPYDRPVALCSGRHDLAWDPVGEVWHPAAWMKNFAGPRSWVDGDRFTLDELSFLSIGCTTQPRGGPADVWIAHSPPAGSATARRQGGGDGGDFRLATALRKHSPRLLLSGQVHEPAQWCERFEDTLVLNPGSSQQGRFPNHILIDTDRRTLRHVADARPEVHVQTCDFDQVPTAGSGLLTTV